ncbi:SUZ domain-containing protein isoform 2 [Cladophialophora immunda]|nr:SUZ domain-containing protein isoform 1 [Cladophialophora immunda]OQV05877.1 SUZ domain-containing protein isoform 2 [Cladophialophora immunda]
MASVTTFAMDEKESIRPDDSASVRAAEDEETSNAPHREDLSASNARGTSRPNNSGVTIAARRYHTLTLTNPPRFGDLPLPIIQAETTNCQPHSEGSIEQPREMHERASSLPLAPDEKLLDALATPKDRLPLLQLEEKFLAFITMPGTDFLDLPPQNSFARLLAHKLADYYSLAHHINEDGTSIRIFRTPDVSMPTPLHVLAQSIPAGPSQPPSAAGFKIMRRVGLGPRQGSAGASTPASSSAPSKATSEAGLETNSEEGIMSPVEGTPNKDKSKLTREEREAQYKAARDRIFGDFQESVTSESASTGENSASMSRSSSSSGKRKARKHKTPKDDSFEARSAFIPSYAPMHTSQMHPQYQPHYSEQAYHGQYQAPNGGFGGNINYSSTPTQAYPNFESSMSYNSAPMGYGNNSSQTFSPAESWSSMQTPSSNGYFNYSASPTTYQQSISPMIPQMNNQFMPTSHPGMQQPQNWMNNQFQAAYPQPQGPPGSNMNGWSGYQANATVNNATNYGYGQLHAQNYGGNGNQPYNAQYPNPSGYSRSLFNPQTRSFVPSNSTSRNGGRSGHNNSNNSGRKKPSSSSSSQTRANSIPPTKSFSSDASGTPPPARAFEKGLASNVSSPKPPPVKEDSLQQKYGAPAHLPKKPPPSQVTSLYDVENINNSSAGGTGTGTTACGNTSNSLTGPGQDNGSSA